MQSQDRGSWASRNWKWAIPVGCFGSLTIFVVLGLGFLSLLFGVIKSSDVYKEAIKRVRSDRRVTEAIGEPITEGFWVGGNIETVNSTGNASIRIPINGSRSSGTIYAVAHKQAGSWTFSGAHCSQPRPTRPERHMLQR